MISPAGGIPAVQGIMLMVVEKSMRSFENGGDGEKWGVKIFLGRLRACSNDLKLGLQILPNRYRSSPWHYSKHPFCYLCLHTPIRAPFSRNHGDESQTDLKQNGKEGVLYAIRFSSVWVTENDVGTRNYLIGLFSSAQLQGYNTYERKCFY
ncbi:hypothetical protein CDAR_490241 [Caerostris darwini]|uniref:Uncharacterized protein n=1 Tax=Caerostris darwini TaxID=1538125 RepID=A0AAV4VAZ5_9ARAC|nr:hypothetical protein CDAR_490241 [Caerostris darwini]